MADYKKVDTSLNFAEREKEVVKFWNENHVFEESVKKNVNVTLKPSNPDELKEVLGKMTPDQLAALKEQISKMQAKDVDAEETAEEEEETEEAEEAKEEYEDDPQE